jgi:hypothetical protein
MSSPKMLARTRMIIFGADDHLRVLPQSVADPR